MIQSIETVVSSGQSGSYKPKRFGWLHAARRSRFGRRKRRRGIHWRTKLKLEEERKNNATSGSSDQSSLGDLRKTRIFTSEKTGSDTENVFETTQAGSIFPAYIDLPSSSTSSTLNVPGKPAKKLKHPSHIKVEDGLTKVIDGSFSDSSTDLPKDHLRKILMLDEPNNSSTVAKKRGRPMKTTIKAELGRPMVESRKLESVKKKRGRPRKDSGLAPNDGSEGLHSYLMLKKTDDTSVINNKSDAKEHSTHDSNNSEIRFKSTSPNPKDNSEWRVAHVEESTNGSGIKMALGKCKYLCPLCRDVFSLAISATKHMQTSHPLEVSVLERVVYSKWIFYKIQELYTFLIFLSLNYEI